MSLSIQAIYTEEWTGLRQLDNRGLRKASGLRNEYIALDCMKLHNSFFTKHYIMDEMVVSCSMVTRTEKCIKHYREET
jgi:hypothetical protein